MIFITLLLYVIHLFLRKLATLSVLLKKYILFKATKMENIYLLQTNIIFNIY